MANENTDCNVEMMMRAQDVIIDKLTRKIVAMELEIRELKKKLEIEIYGLPSEEMLSATRGKSPLFDMLGMICKPEVGI